MAAVLVIGGVRWDHEPFDHIEWHGQPFMLARSYRSYEEYKKDPHPLAPAEAPRVRALLLAIPVPARAAGREARINQLFTADLRFPGYASRYAVLEDEIGRRHELEEFQIPETGKVRSLLYRANPDGTWDLVLDTELPDSPGDALPWMLALKLEQGHLRKYRNGALYAEAKLMGAGGSGAQP